MIVNSAGVYAKRREPPKSKYYATRRAYYLANQERAHKWNLKKLYGITPEQYNALFVGQEGKCKICARHQSEFKTHRLCVDHNHETGQVRALLCKGCNRDVSVLENKKRCDRLKAYLDFYQPKLEVIK